MMPMGSVAANSTPASLPGLPAPICPAMVPTPIRLRAMAPHSTNPA